MTIDIKELEYWNEKILELVHQFGLNCYPQEFDICDHHEMLAFMAYSGMPSHYAHWSYGKSFERQRTLYNLGVSGLPYELVINSNPCLAYLMRDNTKLLQILTMAHVYGHNDFFANNFYFTSSIDAKYTIELFKNNAKRVDRYISDPSIGIDAVEDILDNAHSISMQRNRNYLIQKLSRKEQQERLWQNSQKVTGDFDEIQKHKSKPFPNLDKLPLEPDEDILLFIAEHNPYLADWQRDLITIVDTQAKYFIPQMETKIMNEGWASYWHYKILNTLKLDHDLHLEFLVSHSRVLCPTPGGLNPYHLGFIMWHDIEKRANEEAGFKPYQDFSADKEVILDENNSPGRKKIFQLRESERDSSFLRRFLTEEILRELDIFQHEKRGNDRVISKVADEENWKDIKNTLIANTGSNSLPVIKIEDADFGRKGTLYLKHYHDSRDLQLEYAEHSLASIQKLWGKEVVLETVLNGQKTLLKLDNGKIRIERA